MLSFLIGYMGSGKSTLGRTLSKLTGIPFIDMDAVIEQRNGMSIAEIFAQAGEKEFRRQESELIDEIAAGGNAIVATGGGAPCFFDNMEKMNSLGGTIYLKTSPAKLVRRLENGISKRPLLKDRTTQELEEFISENLKIREPYYLKAKVIIDCDTLTDSRIVEHITAYITKSDKK